jgi:hypothetical protein
MIISINIIYLLINFRVVLPINHIIDDDLKDLILNLLDSNPDKRYTIQDLKVLFLYFYILIRKITG